LNEDSPSTLASQADLPMLLLDGLLCNDAVSAKRSGRWVILGDPTEGALVVMACKGGLDRHQLGHAMAAGRGSFPFRLNANA
jgi:magnesium-transporting ATPase (P-type)